MEGVTNDFNFIGGALFWGVLIGLITQSFWVGVIVGVIAFFGLAMTMGMCIAAGEYDQAMEKAMRDR